MGQKLTWFVIGAVVASAAWLALLANVDAQLLRTFLGFSGN
jgi:arginine exporter protein ArgO